MGKGIMNVREYNSSAWDSKAKSGECEWSIPVLPEDIEKARKGIFSLLLTPIKTVPRSWFPNQIEGAEILCLASGGGQQAPLLAAAGANVTSFDNSRGQLDLDANVAKREGLDIRLEQGDAADLSRFKDKSFDLIFHPCSNCFMPDLEPVWQEAYRVLRQGCALLAGYHNSFLFVFDRRKDEEEGILDVRYSLPYSDLADLDEDDLKLYRSENEPLEYGHTLEQQIGGQISAGFVIAGFFEDYWSDEATALNKYAPTFIATRALKH